MPQKFNAQALAWLRLAYELAAQHGHKEIEPEHLYSVILQDEFCAALWREKPHLKEPTLGVFATKLKAVNSEKVRFAKPVNSDRLSRVLASASASVASDDTPIKPELLFKALVTEAPLANIGEHATALREYANLKLFTAPGISTRVSKLKALDFGPDASGNLKFHPLNGDVGNDDSSEIPGITSNLSKRKAGHVSRVVGENIFGQDHVLSAVEDVLLTSSQDFERENKTAGTFFFRGPTGVGKTQIALDLADHFNIALLRYDMSEYQERHSIARLIGSPPGYVGHDSGGQLINEVNDADFCVVLLDEYEKAHPDIDNFLLGVMDHGIAKDGRGTKASFKNVILIMSSNVGARDAAKHTMGFGQKTETADDRTADAFKKRFSPEFRNRLDVEVEFKDVRLEVMPSIIDKFIAEFSEEMEDRSLSAKFTDAARAHLIQKGMDSEFGPRDVRRMVEFGVKAKVARALFGMTEDTEFTIDYDASQKSLILAQPSVALH